MKRIGIVTHYDVHNHGAVLQLYALTKILNTMSNSIGALAFKKDLRYYSKGQQAKYNLSVRSVATYFRYLTKNGINRTLFNVIKRSGLESFKKEHNLVAGRYGKEQCDLLVVGSDEVFSTEAGISKEFFNIDSPYPDVISYAASFGKTTMADIEDKKEKEIILPGLKTFRKTSTRDKNSRDILLSWGIDNDLVCDPVIMYDFHNELKETVCKKLPAYLLVYAYDNNMNGDEVEYIKEYAKKCGVKIVSAGFYHKWCDKNINCTPLELLGYFKNAECVVTDTFHGSVISIVTNKQFVVKLRNNTQKLGWLLQEYGLTERVSADLDNIDEIMNKKIDYEIVNKEMQRRREYSKQWLERAIGGRE